MTATIPRLLGRDLRRSVGDVAVELGLPGIEPGTGPVVTEAEVAALPPVVQRYLRFMQVVGRPRDRSFLARFEGRFRLGPDRAWMPCDAWQYNAAEPVARIFHMRLDLAHVVPMVGHDTYCRGAARMHGTVLGLVTVADSSGPELDLSELVTYVNDGVLVAPSMLLCPATRWTQVDANTFDVAFTDAGLAVTARVRVNDRGAPVEFSTEDRWAALPRGLVRARWTTPVGGWRRAGGRQVASGASAVWHLPDGPFTYGEGRMTSIEWDVPPPLRGAPRDDADHVPVGH